MFSFYFSWQDVFEDSKITISGLSPVTNYRFQVFSSNGVTELAGEEGKFVEVTVTTEASVTSASVHNVRVTAVKAAEISLIWDPPFSADPDSEVLVETYEVNTLHRFMCVNFKVPLDIEVHLFTASFSTSFYTNGQ